MPLKVVTYLDYVDLGLPNHSEVYNIIKAATSYEDCFVSAMSCGADIIMQISNPVCQVQDLFLTFENYEDLPTILAFYIYSEEMIVYALSNEGKRREELRNLFLQSFGGRYQYILDFSCDFEQISVLSGGNLQPRLLQLDKSESLTEILRGTPIQEFNAFRARNQLDLKNSGYYLYGWYLRDETDLDYSHHKNIKHIYNLIGAILQEECQSILRRHSGGEVFYEGPKRLFALINAPTCRDRYESEVRQIAGELTAAMGTVSANRYMSGYFRSIEDMRDAREEINRLRQYNFFCQDAPLLTERLLRSSKRTPKPGEIEALLQKIQYLIAYDTGNPDIQHLVQRLLLNVIKPSMDYSLFFYCFSNVSSFIYQKLTDRFQSETPLQIPSQVNWQYSSIEIGYGNLSSAIYRLQSDPQAGIPKVKNPLINKAIKYIQKNYAEDISLITLSQHLNISSVYLSQLFKKELGISPIKFIINYRIDRAKELLKETDDPIYNVAVKVGFCEPKYFSKTFKRVTGITPIQYKKSK